MSNPYLEVDDVVDGKAGVAWLKYDGTLTELIGTDKVEAVDTIETEDFKTIGSRKTQTKVKGISGKFTFEIQYHAVKIFSGMVQRYRKTGKLPKFGLVVENNDDTTSLGKRIVSYTDCVLDGDVISSLLTTEDNGMKMTISGKYSDSEVLQDFEDPYNIGRE